MLRVMIVDDTETARLLLRHVINNAPDMQVVGEAHDGHEAVEMVRKLEPDVILMDITMPHMDGLEATRRIMATTPTPIVMVSGSVEGRENEVAFQAMKLGALTLLSKPVGPGDPRFDAQINHLVKTVRTLSTVQVITHRQRGAQPIPKKVAPPPQPTINDAAIDLVLIGSSTGGPAALGEIVRNLTPEFNLPIVIAQHIAAEFVPSLCHWLSSQTAMTVRVAAPRQRPTPGFIDVSPADCSLVFKPNGDFDFDRTTRTSYKPSVNLMFDSGARVFGSRAIGIILTGMGADGADGLLSLRQTGAFTVAQDEESCAVFGMPKEAIERGAAAQVAPVDQIAGILNTLAEDRKVKDG